MLIILLLAASGVYTYYSITAYYTSVYMTVQIVYGCTIVVIVVLYITWSFCWQNKFTQRVQLYLDELNRT